MPREAIPFLMWPCVVPTLFPSLLCRHALWSVKSDSMAKYYSMDGKPLPYAEAAVEFLVLFFLLCLLRKPSENVLSRMIGSLRNCMQPKILTCWLVFGSWIVAFQIKPMICNYGGRASACRFYFSDSPTQNQIMAHLHLWVHFPFAETKISKFK